MKSVLAIVFFALLATAMAGSLGYAYPGYYSGHLGAYHGAYGLGHYGSYGVGHYGYGLGAHGYRLGHGLGYGYGLGYGLGHYAPGLAYSKYY